MAMSNKDAEKMPQVTPKSFMAVGPTLHYSHENVLIFWFKELLLRIGLKGVLHLLADREFENLPRIFRMVAPLVRSTPPQIRPDLLDVIHAMAARSPSEAAFFLQQNLCQRALR